MYSTGMYKQIKGHIQVSTKDAIQSTCEFDYGVEVVCLVWANGPYWQMLFRYGQNSQHISYGIRLDYHICYSIVLSNFLPEEFL